MFLLSEDDLKEKTLDSLLIAKIQRPNQLVVSVILKICWDKFKRESNEGHTNGSKRVTRELTTATMVNANANEVRAAAEDTRLQSSMAKVLTMFRLKNPKQTSSLPVL